MELNINLDNLITPNFRKLFNDIVNCNQNEIIEEGGRSSGKTTQTATGIVVGCTVNRQSAVCVMHTGNKIESRLVSTFREVIHNLGLDKLWKERKSPNEFVLLDNKGRETNVSIKFTGALNPEDLKGFKARMGSFRYVLFEELTNFKNYKEVQTIMDTMLRSTGKHTAIMLYNPPLHSSHWVNKLYSRPVGRALGYSSDYYYETYELEVDTGVYETHKRLIHHSTLYDIMKAGHRDWLGEEPVLAALSKKENPKFWRWNYLGSVEGTDANVFWNIEDWNGDTSKLEIGEILRGFDFGLGGPDPCAFIEVYFDRRNRSLYVLNEFGRPKMSVKEVADNIKKFNRHNFRVWCDSAVPILNQQLRNYGIDAQDVKKWPDSVQAGVKFLQSLSKIYICAGRTPNAYRELKGCEYELDKDENVTSKLPDKDNHWIDAIRYALVLEIMNYDGG